MGIPQDLAKAAKYSMVAAERGDAPAQRYLGHAYLKGLGVPRDKEAAFNWLQKAADQGDRLAQAYLGELHFKNGEIGRAHV